MKTTKELSNLNGKGDTLNKELLALNEDALTQVTGGSDPNNYPNIQPSNPENEIIDPQVVVWE